MIRTKRIYDPPSDEDGFRILVDRLWPRGVKKESADIQLWLKGIAPSTDLRKWYNHDPKKWQEFREKYRDELKDNDFLPNLVSQIRRKKNVTLLFAARDLKYNQAIILKEVLEEVLA